MWTIIITLVIGLLIILFARKFQNNESLSTSASEDASFVDNVLYTFEIVSESSYQTNLKTIVENTAPVSKLIEVAARVLSEPSNPSDRHAIRVEVQGLTVGYLNSQDAKQLAGHNIDKKVSAAITSRKQTNPDQVNYTVKLALKQLDDLR
ncbi:hypothetical protein [Acinetobacter courvalinii]|uniref:hypothetical protein n=1 Tax=Acinetobacter courvalinii TaxID=280147 RepID=UPI00190014A0|nr:hypothetical protein [Acinetobacter courvalinii]MBJ8417139.1 hypothetical protein [Acinetobacter courvalinii]